MLGPGLSPGRFSPDGRWVAYYASDSGRSEIYAVPYPEASRRWQVSSNGGNFSRWSRDGRLVCIDSAHEGSRQMYVLDVTGVVGEEG